MFIASVCLSVCLSVGLSVCLSETKIWSFEIKIWQWWRGGGTRKTKFGIFLGVVATNTQGCRQLKKCYKSNLPNISKSLSCTRTDGYLVRAMERTVNGKQHPTVIFIFYFYFHGRVRGRPFSSEESWASSWNIFRKEVNSWRRIQIVAPAD